MSVLEQQEFALARHIRDAAANPPPPGIEERRLVIYRELFYNNLEDLLAGNFPVIRKLLGDAGWHARIRAFLADHRCQTPLFPEIGREFIRFLEQRADNGADDPPWLPPLAHYEWVELALEIADDPLPPHDPDGDLLAAAPIPSPLAWPLAYDWPVHRLTPDFLPDTPQATYLLVQRDAALKVRFREINALTFRLLQRLEEHPTLDGRTQLMALASEAQASDTATFLAHGESMLQQLRANGVLLGTRP
ncbi:MAG TPA: putative DNA-binding domain-containing protein [Arenimonas sp.]|nr:putative DNA-binding domain-containing protein [Arenimonas sp.]